MIKEVFDEFELNIFEIEGCVTSSKIAAEIESSGKTAE